MRFVIIGTAGHIDHGKSALVRELTGTDPDRLPEEKEREITIDLGFAHMVSGDVTIGFIDVPGHERFIRNMLAGIGGVDGFLMAVSAVEGIREQTREHAEILRLLGIKRGIVAVTKIDLPDARPEIYDECSRYFTDLLGPGVVIIGTSARTGDGMDRLRAALEEMAISLPERDASGVFRLTIDRVFSLKGAGTVVTGTAVGGRIRLGEEVEVLPGGPVCRVRQIQVYGGTVEAARAGQRVAMNVHGVEREELHRGQVAVAPRATLAPSSRLIVTVEEVGLAARPLRSGERVRVCAGSAEVLGRCYLFEGKELVPGAAPVFAEMRLETPLLVLEGDPFIARSFSPVQTHGGGQVVDNSPDLPRRKYVAADLHERARGRIEPLIKLRGPVGLTFAEVVRRRGVEPGEVELQRLGEDGDIVCLLDRKRMVWQGALHELERRIVGEVEAFHAAQPLKPGLPSKELPARLRLSEDTIATAIDRLVEARSLRQSAGMLALPSFSVQLGAEESVLQSRIEEIFSQAGRRPVELAEVAQRMERSPEKLMQLISMLVASKRLVKVATDMWMHADRLQDLVDALRAFKERKPRIGVAEFKELTGTTRKTAIPLLEFLDRQRLTRRDKDERIIV